MRLAVGLATLLLGGCAVFDPQLPVGPEDRGYCAALSSGAREALRTAGFTQRRDGCREGELRFFGNAGDGAEPALVLEHAIALLRDRRRLLTERERELLMTQSATRAVSALGVGVAVAGALFDAPRDLIAGGGVAAATSYTAGTGFATHGMREVLNAGIAALTCVETKAFAARIELGWLTGGGRSAPELPGAVSAARTAIVNLDARLNSPAMATAIPANGAAASLKRQGEQALASARAVLRTLETGEVGGPLLANAVYQRTLDILIMVNDQYARAMPSAEAVMALARGAAGLAVDGVADARQAASRALDAVAKGQADAAVTQAARQPLVAAQGQATDTTEAAPAGRELTDAERRAVSDVASALSELGATLPRLAAAVTQAERGRAAVAEVGACSFETAEGRAPLTLTPRGPIELKRDESAMVVISGGRGPYRVFVTGSSAGGLVVQEFNTGQMTVSASGSAAPGTRVLVIQDFGNPQNQGVNLTVNVTAAP